MTVGNKWMIAPNDAIMLLIDHQSGLFQMVRDIDQPVLRSHAIAVEHITPAYRALMESYDKAQSVQLPALLKDSFAK